MLDTNSAVLLGTVSCDPEYSHKSYGETFYRFVLITERKSGYEDKINVVISERLIWDMEILPGDKIRVEGQVRTYNEEIQGKSHLNIVVFAKTIWKVAEEKDENYVFLEGYICKQPVRSNSTMGREICDLMLAVNRMYNKSDYIPCIAWGRNASYAGGLEIGVKLLLTGRIQSREYRKKDSEGNINIRTAYEVSILKMELGEREF